MSAFLPALKAMRRGCGRLRRANRRRHFPANARDHGGAGACGTGCDTIAANATLRTHTVLAGFAYKFGGPFVMQ
jgi:hypothetical protein